MAVPYSEIQKIEPSAVIELFQLQLNTAQHGVSETYYFHAGVNTKTPTGELVWAGQAYQALPIEVDGFEWNGQGQLPRPKLRVSNIFGTITSILLTLPNGLDGAKVTRIRTMGRFLDAVNFPSGNANADPTAEWPREIYYIDRKSAENRDLVEFELAAAFDLQGVRAPKRQCISNICQWRYRVWTGSAFDYTDVECPYTGAAYYDENNAITTNPSEDFCAKDLTACERRFGALNFTGSVTAGSTTMTGLSGSELARIYPGVQIKGPGIPAGTTVTSEASSTLTLSQAATITTVATRTGTLGALGITLTVSSSSGLIPGMTVSGQDLPSGVRISSISGNVLTLSITYNANVRGSAKNETVTVRKGVWNDELLCNNSSGIEEGDYVANTAGITDLKPQGTNIYKGTRVEDIYSSGGDEVIQLNFATAFDGGDEFVAVFYRPKTFTSATYTFTADNRYTIRPNGILPYGSFPGVGGYNA
jgi:lambda family phage minor tail protein L